MPDDLSSPGGRFIIAPIIGQGAQSLFPNLQPHQGSVFFTPSLTSKNSEIRIARREIVSQARHIERSNEPIRGGIDRYADMATGAALRVHPQPDWDTLGIDDADRRSKIVAAFRREFLNWAYDVRNLSDGEGHYDFGSNMWLAFRNLAGPDAETAIVVHYDEARAERLGARWATFITVIDPDRIETPSDYSTDDNVFEGRRLDANGRFMGMYVRKKHPSEGWTGALEDYAYVPRETAWGRPMAIHWFIKTRGGQQRGMSPLAGVIKSNTMLRKFDESYLGAAIVNSQLATYIRTKSSPGVVAENLAPAPITNESIGAQWGYFGAKVDYYGKSKFQIGGTRLPVLPPDDEIMMSAVDRAINDPGPFRNGYQREFASATGNGFEQFALDYSQSNYSSARAQELQVWRGVMRIRRMFTSNTATPIYGCVIEEAIARGRIDPALLAGAPPFQEYRTAWTACAWTGPGMPQIDPQKEENANKLQLAARTTSRQRIAAARGEDIFEIIDELADEEAYAEEKGVSLIDVMPGMEDPAAEGADDTSTTPGKPGKKRAGGKPARDGDGDGQVDEKGNAP
jgi:lambda family phage portal protein